MTCGGAFEDIGVCWLQIPSTDTHQRCSRLYVYTMKNVAVSAFSCLVFDLKSLISQKLLVFIETSRTLTVLPPPQCSDITRATGVGIIIFMEA